MHIVFRLSSVRQLKFNNHYETKNQKITLRFTRRFRHCIDDFFHHRSRFSTINLYERVSQTCP